MNMSEIKTLFLGMCLLTTSRLTPFPLARPLLPLPHAEDRLLRKKVLESSAPNALSPTWGQEVSVKMQCVLEDRTVVEKDCKLVFVIGEGDVNQVKKKF